MRRATATVLVLAVLLAACQDGAEGRRRPRRVESPSEPPPSATVEPVTTDCTLVLGFSVTANWYRDGAFEQQPGIQDDAWEVIALGGHDVWVWADPTNPAFAKPPESPCPGEPNRIVYQVAAKGWRNFAEGEIAAALEHSIDNIREHWPTAEVVELIPVVGGPGGQPCPTSSTRGGAVDASEMNPLMNELIAHVADGRNVVAGPDLDLADCSQYGDGRGHLTEDGSRYIASVLARYFAS
jgi:hypothetical protein